MIQFDDNQGGRPPMCLACEEMLTDALDQTLSPVNQAWFDRHTAACVECSEMFADAQRGAAWLELLKSPRPEPSAGLVERILAQTSGKQQNDSLLSPIVIGQPAILPSAAPARGNLLAFRPHMPRLVAAAWANPHSQRLAMTAAMAFFSIALTLNLTGVRLDQLHASDLNPANVRKTYYEASADAVRYYDNLRVVRVMESHVDDLRQADDDNRTTPAPAQTTPQAQPNDQPDAKPETKPEPKKPEGGVSRREPPVTHPRFMTTAALAPAARPTPAKKQRAEGPTQLVGLSIPDRPTHHHYTLSQEGGLA